MIKNALIGVDMKSGIVADLAELKQVNAVNRSWNNVIKPILIAAISGMVVWVLTRL
jgi:hypothetical protein